MDDNPERLFESGPLERTVSGALKLAIQHHGPITHQTNGSASKRVSAAVRGFLQNFNATALQAELLTQKGTIEGRNRKTNGNQCQPEKTKG